MNSIIENNKSSIAKLCKENKVDKLYAFGSVLTDNFNENSDIDFVVSFNNQIKLLDYADNYFNLLFSFEDLFNKKIDLITEKSLKNPYFIKEVNETKQLIYGT
ncbi:COG1669 Predicted nucleotidyltransferases [Flavobacteriaceae bacterium]